MTEILPPNRVQLAEFIRNQETIRRFEILFRMVGEDLPDAIENSTESALSAANLALSLVNDLAQQVGNEIAALESIAAMALDQSERNKKELQNTRFYIHAVTAL